MNRILTLTALLVIGGLSAYGAATEDSEDSQAQAAFQRICAMEGTWVADEGDGTTTQTIFRVTAGGTAVLETIFAGTEKEMLTVYYVSDGQLCLTHYCMLGNQPEMRGALDGNRIKFGFCGGCNIDVDQTMHMNNAEYELISPDRFKTTWNLYNEGKHAEAHSFEFVRQSSDG